MINFDLFTERLLQARIYHDIQKGKIYETIDRQSD